MHDAADLANGGCGYVLIVRSIVRKKDVVTSRPEDVAEQATGDYWVDPKRGLVTTHITHESHALNGLTCFAVHSHNVSVVGKVGKDFATGGLNGISVSAERLRL